MYKRQVNNVYMSATLLKTPDLSMTKRYHGYPLDIPKCYISNTLLMYIIAIKLILKFKKENKPVLIFVPTIKLTNTAYRYFNVLAVSYTHLSNIILRISCHFGEITSTCIFVSPRIITLSTTIVVIITTVIPYKTASIVIGQKITCNNNIPQSNILINQATEIPVFLFTNKGGISIPPVLAPTLKTKPKPNPIHKPPYNAESKISLVIFASCGILPNKAINVGYKNVLNKVPKANFFPKKMKPMTNMIKFITYTVYDLSLIHI